MVAKRLMDNKVSNMEEYAISSGNPIFLRELVEKVRMLLNQPEKRKAIAKAGHKRCLSSGYDVVSRMRVWDDVICKKLDIIKKK